MPPRRGPGVLPWLLALALVSAALYGLLGGHEMRPQGLPQEHPAKAAVSEPGISIRVPPDEPPTVHRCVVGGNITYTNTGCASDEQATPLPIASDTPGRSYITFYQCKNPAGRLYWSARHCHEQQSRVERTFTVPADLPFQQQVALAEHRLAGLKPAPTARATGHASVTSADPQKVLICADLEAKVKRLDAYARQALSAQRQDEVRSERQQARDEQFRRRC